MVECDYCDGTFEDEASYLEHLRDAHEGELGAVDQRRVEQLEEDGTAIPTGPAVLGGVLIVAVGLVAFLVLGGGGGGGDGSGGVAPLPDRGDQAVIDRVQTEPASSTEHVSTGSDVDYETVPPTGGPHYDPTVRAGFYEEPQSLGALVHTLEHGAVIVYYDPAALTPAARQNLREYATQFTGRWQSFLAVPNPSENPESAYVLTAWEKRLTLSEYDADAVRAFTAEYLGRGPENAVR